MRRYAVITTHDRPRDLLDCYMAVDAQVDHVVVVAHRAAYGDEVFRHLGHSTVVHYDAEIPNISTMWNIGLEEADRHAEGAPYHVAVLNDDAVVPEDWFDAVGGALSLTGASAGSTDQHGVARHRVLHTEPGPLPDLRWRMSGFAFVLDGAAGLRLDEQFRWWYGDDDLEWTARTVGAGVVKVPGHPVEHRHAGSTTVGHLAEVAGHDRQRFIDKHGEAPH